jgi:hypothetical protein
MRSTMPIMRSPGVISLRLELVSHAVNPCIPSVGFNKTPRSIVQRSLNIPNHVTISRR